MVTWNCLRSGASSLLTVALRASYTPSLLQGTWATALPVCGKSFRNTPDGKSWCCVLVLRLRSGFASVHGRSSGWIFSGACPRSDDSVLVNGDRQLDVLAIFPELTRHIENLC